VLAPYRAAAGTGISPMLSFSIRNEPSDMTG
jgi:hypothetical protein